MGVENSILEFQELEWDVVILGNEPEWQIPFPNLRNGNGTENSIPNFREREWDVVIPGNLILFQGERHDGEPAVAAGWGM